jgi:hypothetical protein
MRPLRQKLDRRNNLVNAAQARRAAEADFVPDVLRGRVNNGHAIRAVSIFLLLSLKKEANMVLRFCWKRASLNSRAK